MRLDCPKCGAKGDSRLTKTPRWRCSPARSNGGCGYTWDDPNFNSPNIDYKAIGMDDAVAMRRRQLIYESKLAEEEESRRNPPPPPTPPPQLVPNPVGWGESPAEKGCAYFAVVLSIAMVVFIAYSCVTQGFPDFTGDDDGYKETCVIEDRGGRIRETCW